MNFSEIFVFKGVSDSFSGMVFDHGEFSGPRNVVKKQNLQI